MIDELVKPHMPNATIQSKGQSQQTAEIDNQRNGRFALFYVVHDYLLFAYHNTSDKGVSV